MKPSVYFRTDGNESIGLGHIYRCLSLAGILQPAFESVFIFSKTPRHLFEKIDFLKVKSMFIEHSDEQLEMQWIESSVPSSSLIVIDSYEFTDGYFRDLLQRGYKTVFVDDQNKINTEAYAIINHLVGSERNNYLKAKKIFLGPAYAILREEFLKAVHKPSKKIGESIFVSLGGADKDHVTNKVVKCLLTLGKKINVLIGAGFTGQQELEIISRANPRAKIFKEKPASEIIELISDSEFAVITPGMISYELFTIGIPAVCGYISSSQRQVVSQFEEHGLIANGDDFNEVSLMEAIDRLTLGLTDQMVSNQKKIFDGRSGERLVEVFKSMHGNDQAF